MRGLVVLISLAGCGFEHGALQPSGGSNVDIDAGVALIDASPDVPGQDAFVGCADDDADGVCNGSDDWPCGIKPAAPPATVTMTGNGGATTITLTLVNLDATGRLAEAGPNVFISLGLHYAITDTACTGNCIDQIEVGWVPGGRSGCVFDGGVSRMFGAAGDFIGTIRTPTPTTLPAVYDLRANIGQNFSCYANGATGWWGGTPEATRTIAKLCVH